MSDKIKEGAQGSQGGPGPQGGEQKPVVPTTSPTPTPPTPPAPEEKVEFKMEDVKVGTKVGFYPTGAEKPVIIRADKAFVELKLEKDVIEKHKYFIDE